MDEIRIHPLAHKRCLSCEGLTEPLTEQEVSAHLAASPHWALASDKKSTFRTFQFSQFSDALAFVDGVGAIAETEWHHPTIELSWGKVVVTFSTHAVHGLSENDFIMAAKTDEVYAKTSIVKKI